MDRDLHNLGKGGAANVSFAAAARRTLGALALAIGCLLALPSAALAVAPTVTTSPGCAIYQNGDPPVTIDPGLTVADPDSTNLASATVRIASNFTLGDELIFVNQGGISGIYNTGTGVLTMTGTATVATYQDALRSVQFNHTASFGGNRIIEFTVDDGIDGSAPATREVAPVCTPAPPPPQPQPEPEPEPTAKADGTLTIDANKGKVEKGRKVTLTGQLDVPGVESCERNRTIELQRRLKSEDDSKFATFETVTTDANGNYSVNVKVRKTYFYRAIVGETEACDDETSNSQKVRVQKPKAAQEA